MEGNSVRPHENKRQSTSGGRYKVVGVGPKRWREKGKGSTKQCLKVL